MGIISKSRLHQFRNTGRNQLKSINESLEEFSLESSYGKVTVFLSHKHDEKEDLDAAISFLKNVGVQVYVDWLDEEMPKITAGETAVRIKQKIKENNKFIFLATEGAILSKWCNWELGLGDAQKYINHIAVLPIKNDYNDYGGAEYLRIYPHIYESNATPGSFFVKFPNRDVTPLEKWLKS